MAVATETPHPLQSSFCFTYMRRQPAKKTTEEGGETKTQNPNPYETSIKTICEVGTVESFWSAYDFLTRPGDLPNTTDYHVFRSGIKPTWEDESNAKGGKWIVRLPKGLSSRYWEEIVLALIGGQFAGVPDGEVCGAVLSIRFSEDILGLWNRSAADRDIVDSIRDTIKKVLRLPAQAYMEYKPHQKSMQDRSSFRNTNVWKPKSQHGAAEGSNNNNNNNNTRRSGSWGEDRKPKNRDRDSGRWR